MSDELAQVTERPQPTAENHDRIHDLVTAWHHQALGILRVTWYEQERDLIVRKDGDKLYPLAIFWTPADEQFATPPEGTEPKHINPGMPPPTAEKLAEVINLGLEEDALAMIRVHYKDTERTIIVYVRDGKGDKPDAVAPLAIIWEETDGEHCTCNGDHPILDNPAPDDTDDSPITAANIADCMIEFESGELSEERTIKMFQFLLDSGMILSLQGRYQRMAQMLLMMGLITKSEPV